MCYIAFVEGKCYNQCMKCTCCGKEVQEGRFCPRCGRYVEKETNGDSEQQLFVVRRSVEKTVFEGALRLKTIVRAIVLITCLAISFIWIRYSFYIFGNYFSELAGSVSLVPIIVVLLACSSFIENILFLIRFYRAPKPCIIRRKVTGQYYVVAGSVVWICSLNHSYRISSAVPGVIIKDNNTIFLDHRQISESTELLLQDKTL